VKLVMALKCEAGNGT